MQEVVRVTHLTEALLGRGGRHAMTERDFGRVGRLLRDQYDYLRGFAREIAEGALTEAQIRARSALYVEAGTQSYERARVAAHGMPDLPAYPSSVGATACGPNCRCWWQIEETADGWEAYWKLNPSRESCADCLANAATWNPLVVPRS